MKRLVKTIYGKQHVLKYEVAKINGHNVILTLNRCVYCIRKTVSVHQYVFSLSLLIGTSTT